MRDADRRLENAGATAASDADRRKIATAQQAIHLAQEELAAEGTAVTLRVDPDLTVGLDGLQVNLDELQKRLDSPEFQAALRKQAEEAERMSARFKSPEFQASMRKQREAAERMSAQVNSPQFQARLQKQVADAAAMRVKFESPEFQARIQKQLEAARRMQEHYTSPEFQKHLNEQLERSNELIARMETPSFSEGGASQSPIKAPASVMAGNILTKTTPVYPPSAKEAKIQGEVVLRVLVNEQGRPEQVSKLSSPDDALTQASIEAVQQWVWKPYLLNGKPTAVDTTVSIHFSFAQ